MRICTFLHHQILASTRQGSNWGWTRAFAIVSEFVESLKISIKIQQNKKKQKQTLLLQSNFYFGRLFRRCFRVAARRKAGTVPCLANITAKIGLRNVAQLEHRLELVQSIEQFACCGSMPATSCLLATNFHTVFVPKHCRVWSCRNNARDSSLKNNVWN